MKNQGREKERGLKNENLSLSRKKIIFSCSIYVARFNVVSSLHRGVREIFFVLVLIVQRRHY